MKNILRAMMILSLCSSAGYAASFACDTAKTRTEKTICQNRSLNDADLRMATIYPVVIHALAMGSRQAEKDLQHQWLKQRDSCGSNVNCIAQRYHERQKHLDDIVQNRILTQGPF